MSSVVNVVIIEDESRAANRLERMLKIIDPQFVICAKIPSVEKACQWLSANNSVDLIFLDIQLEDGECFEIFDAVTVTTPIIFCTAFNEYALQAFKVNSIDYLLKPINQQELSQATHKFQRLQGAQVSGGWSQILSTKDINNEKCLSYRKRFLVTSRKQLIPIQVLDVNVITAFMKGIKLITAQREWLLDDSLSEISTTLSPDDFVRISRQSIVRIDAIQAFDLAKLEITVSQSESTIVLPVSRSRASQLKAALSK